MLKRPSSRCKIVLDGIYCTFLTNTWFQLCVFQCVLEAVEESLGEDRTEKHFLAFLHAVFEQVRTRSRQWIENQHSFSKANLNVEK